MRGDDANRLFGNVGVDLYFDAQLGQEVHDIFGAAIDFGVALLAAVTLDLGDGHAVDADGSQGLAHLVKLERFDDRDDEFHGQAFISRKSFLLAGSAGRGGPAVRPNLASFWANGTKKLQV